MREGAMHSSPERPFGAVDAPFGIVHCGGAAENKSTSYLKFNGRSSE